jgi:hypothetical protein
VTIHNAAKHIPKVPKVPNRKFRSSVNVPKVPKMPIRHRKFGTYLGTRNPPLPQGHPEKEAGRKDLRHATTNFCPVGPRGKTVHSISPRTFT